MENVCPACKNENRETAAYCDRCGQHLTAAGPGGEDACPACGGSVTAGANGGECSGCGLVVAEAPPPTDELRKVAAPGAVERLIADILKGVAGGRTIPEAVAQACAEALSGGEHAAAPAPAPMAPPAAAATPKSCPLCGAAVPNGRAACPSCAISFGRPIGACPRCERPAEDDHCECGAILTLEKLLEFVEPGVKWFCSRCKQPYAVAKSDCPSCHAPLLAADKLKAFAKSLEG